MKQIILSVLAFGFLATMTGCKDVEISDGRVPADYLAKAKAFEGIYHGSFEGHKGNLVLVFDGDRPNLSFEDGASNDILAAQCASTIGQLKTVHLKGRTNKTVSSVGFQFDPNNCRYNVGGRTLTLELKDKADSTEIIASIYLYDRRREECTVEGGDPAHGIPPRHVCRTMYDPVFAVGKFVR